MGTVWRLTAFELQKVYCRRGFRFSLCVLLLLNIFFLWYTNLGNGSAPELSSYRMFTEDIKEMTEEEKDAFVSCLKEKTDGLSFVARILSMQESEVGQFFAEEEMAEHPGVFEKYYDIYAAGDYLRYTSSLELESIFVNEMYEEEKQAANYSEYLESVQRQKDMLFGISIFAPQDSDSFASRNLQKSADDHRALSADGIKWTPSKTVCSSMENVWTDIILLLHSFLFVGSLITEEKQKGLLYITRSTKYGMGVGIISKLSALLVDCLLASAVFFFSDVLFFGYSSGMCDFTAKLQSIAPYMESAVNINIIEFMLLSVLTKALVIFGVGAVLTALCIISESIVPPYFIGAALWTIGWALYRFVSAASALSAVKYVNIFGALRTEELYGKYLNLNIGGIPVSRLFLAWLVIAAAVSAGIILSLISYLKGEKLELKRAAARLRFGFRPHDSVFRHEGYKILIAEKGLLILLLFSILMGYNIFHRSYHPTAEERYYQNIMLRLEGTLTEEKRSLIEAEKARYREAFSEIEKIDRMAAANEIDSETANAMKIKWNSVTAFYPAFQRVEAQAELVCENGGCFIYDTGYLYLLGVLDENRVGDFLLLTLGILFAFGSVMSVEHETGIWGILCATAKGKKRILQSKTEVCGISAALFSQIPFVCRFVSISMTFPIRGLLYPAGSIPVYRDIPQFIPAVALLLFKMLVQAAVVLAITFEVTALSAWRKNHAQVMFFGFVLLCAPLVLSVLGFTFAQYFSLYPLYTCAF